MTDLKQKTWQLTAVSEVLGDLVLTVEETLTVGRGKDNDIVIGSKEMSRKHAELSVFNEQLFVKDLGSSNGTTVNEVKIEPNKSEYLKQEDIVTFASFSFKVNSNSQNVDSKTLKAELEDQDVSGSNAASVVNPIISEPQLKHDTDANTVEVSSEVVDTLEQQSGEGNTIDSPEIKLATDTQNTADLSTDEVPYSEQSENSEIFETEQSQVDNIVNSVISGTAAQSSTHDATLDIHTDHDVMSGIQVATEQVTDTAKLEVPELKDSSLSVATSEFVNEHAERNLATTQNNEVVPTPVNNNSKTESSLTKASHHEMSDTSANPKSMGLLMWLVLALVLIGLVLWFMLQR